MPTSTDEITVARNDESGRYEIHVGDVLAGFTLFERTPDDELIFPHTEIDPAFSGRGLGTALVSEALADVARRGERIIPLCPFVRRYLHENHIEGLDIDWSAGGAG